MTSMKTLSVDDLCRFIGSHGGTLTVDKPRDGEGRRSLHGTQLQIALRPDGYRPVAVMRLVTDDDLHTRPDVDLFARELEGMVRQIEREHPSLPAASR